MQAKGRLNKQTKRFRQLTLKAETAADELLLKNLFALLAFPQVGTSIRLSLPKPDGPTQEHEWSLGK